MEQNVRIEEIESVIKDQARSDDEVYELLEQLLTDSEDKETLDLYADLERLSDLVRVHRPAVYERIRQKVIADHAHCCGGNHSSSEDCCGGDCDCNNS